MPKALWCSVLGVVLGVVLGGCVPAVVDSGYMGVRTKWGSVDDTPVEAGLYWNMPFRDQIVPMDARVLKKESSATASSRDLQVVTTIIALNYRIERDKAAVVYSEIGRLADVDSRIIDPVLQEAVKTATARYNAEELITKRPEVKAAIVEYVTEVLARSNLIVVDLNIVNFEFDAQYQQAVEAKQVAEQQAQAATNDLRRIEVEAKQAEASARGRANAMLVEAKAEAERQELLKGTVSDQLVELEAVRRWNGVLPQVTSGGGTLVELAGLKR
ncbi:MAG TPA: prohibitin family protein [Deltaproteobacteria bacterium]|nr:prohibitin family protein [Deltaproteobacteria bacterium]